MMTNRQISENFEVQINTLYNWRKSKPKLYKYLQNADYNFDQSKEMNVVLNRFAQEIHYDFSAEEILAVVQSKFEAKTLDEIEECERYFIKEHAKRLAKESEFFLGIYSKIHAMNVVEKYIFYKRVHNLRSEKKEPELSDIKEYFDVFCS